MLWKTVDSVYLLEFGLKVSVLWITSERGIDFPSPAVSWQLQRPSDSATSSRDSGGMRFALGCIFFKKKGKEEKSFRLGYFKAVWGRKSIPSLASYLGMLSTCCLGCGMSAGRGWSQGLFCSGKSWSHSCSWWRTFNPPQVDSWLWESVSMNSTLAEILAITSPLVTKLCDMHTTGLYKVQGGWCGVEELLNPVSSLSPTLLLVPLTTRYEPHLWNFPVLMMDTCCSWSFALLRSWKVYYSAADWMLLLNNITECYSHQELLYALSPKQQTSWLPHDHLFLYPFYTWEN